ncbi:hypothetical protein JZ751_020474 [Albula glossodonta]|uniref:Ig-like domain-containing protein n=1 Tax=Albula glossodonta TaxID=121402 RepID=A0A8T2PL75_9TELE|nr:hypothetical protein JZ751_020474 [Albula glossodonta]
MLVTHYSTTAGKLHPAHISCEKPQVEVGEDVELTCSISEPVEAQSSATWRPVIMYLCKNGKYPPTEVKCEGVKGINVGIRATVYERLGIANLIRLICLAVLLITVPAVLVMEFCVCSGKDKLHPAHISCEKPQVEVGEDVELTCSISDPVEAQSSATWRPVNMYLCKNGVGLRMSLHSDVKSNSFTIKNATVEDSGAYSCVYSAQKLRATEVKCEGVKGINVGIRATDTTKAGGRVPGGDGTGQSAHGGKYIMHPEGGGRVHWVTVCVVLLLMSVLLFGVWRYRWVLKQAPCFHRKESESKKEDPIYHDIAEFHVPQGSGQTEQSQYFDGGYSTIEYKEQRRKSKKRSSIEELPYSVIAFHANADAESKNGVEDMTLYAKISTKKDKGKRSQPDTVYAQVKKK